MRRWKVLRVDDRIVSGFIGYASRCVRHGHRFSRGDWTFPILIRGGRSNRRGRHQAADRRRSASLCGRRLDPVHDVFSQWCHIVMEVIKYGDLLIDDPLVPFYVFIKLFRSDVRELCLESHHTVVMRFG